MQVGHISDFTGRMTGNRHDHIVRMNAHAIIHYFNHTHAALGNMYLDIVSTRIDSIFEQLFHHRCRTRYNLTRC